MQNKFIALIITIAALTGVAPLPAAAGELGAILGGVTGAVIGHNVGPRSKRDINTVWGVLGGAALGYMVEEHVPSVQTRRAAAPEYGRYAPAPSTYCAPARYDDGLVERRVIITRETHEVVERRLPTGRLSNTGYQGRYTARRYTRGW